MEAWAIVLLTAGITTAITTLVSLIVTHLFKKSLKRKEDRDNELFRLRENEIREQRKRDMLETISLAVKPLENKIDKLDIKLEANTTGTVTLLRDRMKSDMDECVDQGYATDTDKANWMELYNSYKSLGGNHFREYVDHWKLTVERLSSKSKRTRKVLNETKK